MDDIEHHKALMRTLETRIAQEEGATRLLSMTTKIKCQIELGDNDNATVTCVEMVSMFEQINLLDQTTTVMNELHDEIKLLVERFIEINVDSSLFLQRCRFDLIIGFFDGHSRLDKLFTIVLEMKQIVMELKKQNKCIKFKKQYPLMDKISKEMQQIGDVDLKVKCETIACFLKYYGDCCNVVADCNKSIEIYRQAILLMESILGDNANHYQLLGRFYHNLAFAYEVSNKLAEAKQYYEITLKIYNQAKDWTDDQQKVDFISHITEVLQGAQYQLLT